jgi:hypothetical protein
MNPSDQAPKLLIRLPDDVKAFVAEQAKRYGSSQNSEIVRAIRERMDRVKTADNPGKEQRV